jgi:hypothetical protein
MTGIRLENKNIIKYKIIPLIPLNPKSPVIKPLFTAQ